MDLNNLEIVNGKVQVKRPPTNTLDKYMMASRMIDDDIAEDNNSREVRKALRDDDPRQKKGESVDQWKARLKLNAELKKYSCADKGRFKSASGGQYCEDIQRYPDEDLDEYESDFVNDEIEYETDVSSDEDEKVKKKKLKRKREEVEAAVDIPPDTENTMEDADSEEESSSDGSSSGSSSSESSSEEEEEPKPPRRTMPRKRTIQEPMLEEEAEPEPEPAARERKRAKVRKQAPSQGEEYIRGSTVYLVTHAGEFMPSVTLENKRVEPDWSKLERDHFWTLEEKKENGKLCIFLFSEEGRCWPASFDKVREFEFKRMAKGDQIQILKEGNVQPSTQPGYKKLMTHPEVFEMMMKAEKKRLQMAEPKKKPAATTAAPKTKGTAKLATSTTHTDAVDSVLHTLVQTFYKLKPEVVMSAMVGFLFKLEHEGGADIMMQFLTFKHKNEEKWQQIWRVFNQTKNGLAVVESFTEVFGDSDDVLNLALIHAMLDYKLFNLLSQQNDLVQTLHTELNKLRNPAATPLVKQEVLDDVAPTTKSEPL
jgi:hypothetical protein